MSKLKFACVWIAIVFTFLCISTAFANIDTQTERTLSKIQGQWYDINGNLVLDFEGKTVNGCPVVGVYNLAGGGGHFSCIIRVVESSGYRDLAIGCIHVGGTPNYHSQIVLDYNCKDARKGVSLLRTKKAQYYETVGGIGLDMPAKEVLASYGKPDLALRENNHLGVDKWVYTKLGLELRIRYKRVWMIRIWKWGDRRFDRTGFNCNNAPFEFQEAYGFHRVPRGGQYGSYTVGIGEYMWFDDYPRSILLSPYSN